jgi:hypothetical protein
MKHVHTHTYTHYAHNSDADTTDRLLAVLSPIVVDPPAGMSLMNTASTNSGAKVPAAAAVGAAGTVVAALESEQQLLAQLVHHVSLADTDVAYQVSTTMFTLQL